MNWLMIVICLAVFFGPTIAIVSYAAFGLDAILAFLVPVIGGIGKGLIIGFVLGTFTYMMLSRGKSA